MIAAGDMMDVEVGFWGQNELSLAGGQVNVTVSYSDKGVLYFSTAVCRRKQTGIQLCSVTEALLVPLYTHVGGVDGLFHLFHMLHVAGGSLVFSIDSLRL